MKLNESRNLRYEKLPKRVGPAEGLDHIEPEHCILDRFSRVDDKIKLFFKNGSQAEIKAVNIDGGREIDLLEDKMKEYVDRSYKDILDINI